MGSYPVRITATNPTTPNRWLWAVKWLLLLPHYLVLAILWAGFLLVMLWAYAAVLCTSRYPRRAFAFSVGVLRWTWRVMFYGYVVLGTDRYPPFTLKAVSDYPADLEVDETLARQRRQPLLAWLLSVPHAMIIGGLIDTQVIRVLHIGSVSIPIFVGITAVGISVVAMQLAITGRHPQGLYDLFTGVGRWMFRAVSYLALLTDVYPPFRLDQGGAEPGEPSIEPAAGRLLASSRG